MLNSLFFKVFSIKIYTLLHPFESTFEALFPLLWRQLQTCVLNPTAACLGVGNHYPIPLFFMCGNKKALLGDKSVLYGY